MDFQTFVRKKSLEFFESNKVVFVEDNKSMVDEILHYESLNEELARVSERLCLPQNLGEIYSGIIMTRCATNHFSILNQEEGAEFSANCRPTFQML